MGLSFRLRPPFNPQLLKTRFEKAPLRAAYFDID